MMYKRSTELSWDGVSVVRWLSRWAHPWIRLRSICVILLEAITSPAAVD